jgi:uncharacterized protein (TIGR00730 family)
MNNAALRICVYAASSQHCAPAFHAAARELGELLAEARATLVYGGGGAGLMGSLADGALARGGHVIGIIPRFMTEVEWQHPGIAALEVVEDMRERKHRLLTGADAVIALPGGCGTLEELAEAITLKRLGLYFNPIVLVNTEGFWDPLVRLLDDMVEARFLNPEHREMWSVVREPKQVLPAIASARHWPENARDFAVVKS